MQEGIEMNEYLQVIIIELAGLYFFGIAALVVAILRRTK